MLCLGLVRVELLRNKVVLSVAPVGAPVHQKSEESLLDERVGVRVVTNLHHEGSRFALLNGN